MASSRIDDDRQIAAAEQNANVSLGYGTSPGARPATDGQKIKALLIAGAIAFLTASVGAIATNQLPKVAAFLPAYQTTTIIAYVVTAYLIFAQYRVTRAIALLYLSGGCFYTAAILIAQFMSFPGMFLEQGALYGGSQTTIWLWCAWHIGPSIGMLLYIVSEWRRPNYTVPDTALAERWFAIGLVAVFAATMCSVTLFHDYLPILDVKGNFGRIASTGIGPGIELVTATALVLLWWSTGFRTLLQVWLGVALFALLCDNVITMLGADRLSIGWYVGRLNALISAVTIMCLYLGEIKFAYLTGAAAAQQLAVSHAKLEVAVEQGLIDDLTGLPGRGLFLKQAELNRSRNAGTGMSTAVLFLDLDGFKAINDQHGHAYGDAVLVQFAEVLRTCLRDSDVAGRFGGDEFVVCLSAPSANIEAVALRVAERIAHGIENKVEGIGCSVGIKSCEATGLDVEAAIEYADKAMYAQKREGKARLAKQSRPRLVG
jgi:diguanylate cyclase